MVVVGASFLLAGVASAAPAGSDPDPSPTRLPEETGPLVRGWRFTEYVTDLQAATEVDSGSVTGSDLLDERYIFGPLVVGPRGPAVGKIMSGLDASGLFISSAVPDDGLGNRAELVSYQAFRKDADDATLVYHPSSASMVAIDRNGAELLEQECDEPTMTDCSDPIQAEVYLDIAVYTDDVLLFRSAGGAMLTGWRDHWTPAAWSEAFAPTTMWEPRDFRRSYNRQSGVATQSLSHPTPVAVDLSAVRVGASFTARVVAYVDVADRRVNQEFPASTALADLVEVGPSGGAERISTGLTVEGEPVLRMPAATPLPVCETAPDPAAGELQFSADTYRIAEAVGAGPQVLVTREGGSTGAVSVAVSTADGTADDSDYASTTTTVNFADGDTTPRAVRLPIHHDLTDESNETVTLTLSDPRGCADIGERDTATLTIVDDDRPPVVDDPTYTVGGTVVGLEGDGLILTHLGEQIAPLNGPFNFTEELPDGFPYDVRVATQPSAPDQTCTVIDGIGTIAGADVGNILVDCVTAAPDTELDPTFGGDGTITTPGLRGAKAITVRPDGKLVVAGERFLARYDDADGALDGSFGDGGIVTTGLDSGFLDFASDVAIAPDGKIVAVGIDNSGPSEDFRIERYDPSGVPDASFGAAGTGAVTTDFHGDTDRAYAVAVQPDGKIVVAGHATDAAGTGNDFAVARYDVDGELDPTFGDDGTGMVTTDIAGVADFAYAIALQPDGAIVLAGRVSNDGGGGFFGLARYTPDGRLDGTFGSNGTTIGDFGHGGIAEAVVVQPDGKLLVAGNAIGDFALARFDADGSQDLTFGTGGLVTTDFGPLVGNTPAPDYAHDLAVDTDGSIVVVGTTEFGGGSDFAIARYDSDGDLDPGFGTDGLLTVDFAAGFDSGHDIAIQPDGKIVAVGTAHNGSTFEPGLIRLSS